MTADVLVLIGFLAVIAGIGVTFGSGWALIVGGLMAMAAGAQVERASKGRAD